jgi:hypothetical protein
MPPPCTFSTFLARTDAPYFESTLPHLLRSCNFPFADRVALLDDRPSTGDFLDRPEAGASLDSVRAGADRLLHAGWLDRVSFIDYSPAAIHRVSRIHFGAPLSHTHDFRGYPVYGVAYAIEEARTRYVLHMDADMLLHQAPDHDWISRGIRLLQSDPSIAIVCPHPGPPAPPAALRQRGVAFRTDPRGLLLFQRVTSRKMLIDREKLALHLPVQPAAIGWLRRLARRNVRGGSLRPWEDLLTRLFVRRGLYRADLADATAWSLHPPDHGPRFVALLDRLIPAVEAGRFPPAQVGDYDLQLGLWEQFLGTAPAAGRQSS